ncbi:MAG TPA: hypothetical protein V6C86_02285 [Oculatellaceae cyanobacterium]
MKWQLILPLVALFSLALVPQAALAHHHHHCWGHYGNMGYGGYGGYGRSPYGYGYGSGVNPWAQRAMFAGGPYGYGGYGGSPYGYGGYGNGGMINTFGRLIRGF